MSKDDYDRHHDSHVVRYIEYMSEREHQEWVASGYGEYDYNDSRYPSDYDEAPTSSYYWGAYEY